MKIDILTLFPDMFSAMQESILGRAQKSGKIQINIVNIRDYTEDKHLKCDDYPFGGGAGMVMMAPPIGNAIEASIKPVEFICLPRDRYSNNKRCLNCSNTSI